MLQRSFQSLALAASLLASLPAAQAAQNLVAGQSEIGFTIRQMGVPVSGRFKRYDAQIAFDPAKPEASKLAFTVDIGSASLGTPEVDAELPKPVWFNLPQFPQATFKSTAVKRIAADQYEVSGKLAIKGSEHEVRVPVRVSQSGAQTQAQGSFSLKRLAFRIGEKEWADTSMVADDVTVNFKLALTGVGKL